MYPNSIYFWLSSSPYIGTLGLKYILIWVHGPLGYDLWTRLSGITLL